MAVFVFLVSSYPLICVDYYYGSMWLEFLLSLLDREMGIPFSFWELWDKPSFQRTRHYRQIWMTNKVRKNKVRQSYVVFFEYFLEFLEPFCRWTLSKIFDENCNYLLLLLRIRCKVVLCSKKGNALKTGSNIETYLLVKRCQIINISGSWIIPLLWVYFFV